MNKINILTFTEDDEHLFDNDLSEHFSIEEETQELLNEVFNQKYQPVYDPQTTKMKEKEYQQIKKTTNDQHKKERYRKNDKCRIYQNFDDEAVSPAFNQFLMREQERVEKRNEWIVKERSKKEQGEIQMLKKKPQILRGSRQAQVPIYERCIDLQKNKEKQLEQKRSAKFRHEISHAQSFSYHPSINGQHSQRTYEEYFCQKELWQKEKDEQVKKQRVEMEVRKLSQCTFVPNLVAKYNKPNSRIIPGEKVEERLLRSLQKPYPKAQK